MRDLKAKMTEDEVETQCLADYEAVAGKIVLATEIECYADMDSASVTVECDPPAPVRVLKMGERTVSDHVTRWMGDDVCDPIYRISLVDPDDSRFNGLRASWIYGVSRYIDGRLESPRFVLAPDDVQERFPEQEPIDMSWVELAGGP